MLCPHAFPYARTNISAALESSHLIIIHCNDSSVVYLGSIYNTNASGTKQIPETNTIQIELNRVKNPNWPEATSLLFIRMAGRGFELGTTVNKSS